MFYAASTRRFCRKSNGTHATPRKPPRCVAFRFTKSTPPRRKMTVLRMWHRESHTACNPRPRQQPGGFRLPSPPPSPMCAPVRRGFVPVASAGPQQTASYGNRQGALADRSAAAFAFSPRRPAMALEDARGGIRPRGQFGHQDRRKQPPGRKNSLSR